MPVIEVTMVEGRDGAKKKALIKELTDAAEHAIGAPRQSIRVILREIPGEHYGIAGVAKTD